MCCCLRLKSFTPAKKVSVSLPKEKAGLPQIHEEGPPFFVYRIKSRFSIKRRNPNPSPTWKIKFGFLSFGPSGESRTHGLLNPIQARYQTALHPDVWPGVLTGDVVYYIPYNRFCQRKNYGFTIFIKVFLIFCAWLVILLSKGEKERIFCEKCIETESHRRINVQK